MMVLAQQISDVIGWLVRWTIVDWDSIPRHIFFRRRSPITTIGKPMHAGSRLSVRLKTWLVQSVPCSRCFPFALLKDSWCLVSEFRNDLSKDRFHLHSIEAK